MTDSAIIDLAEFIYESEAIEGIQDDPDALMKQVQARVQRMKKLGHQDNWGQGHIGAMLMLESLSRVAGNQYLDKKLICDVQALITAEQHKKPGGHELPKEWIGEYRSVNVSVGGRKCPEPELVPGLMEKLLNGRRFIWWQENARFQAPEKNIAEIADFHFKFLMIHPFVDGNGRTARALAYFLLRANPPHKQFIFTDRDKHETYYRCFDDPGNSGAMRRYFLIKSGLDPNDA